jgi:glycosyltransferase involved in cell wall biosynthesis
MRLIVATSSYPVRASESVNAGVFVRDIVAEFVKQGNAVHVMTPDKGQPVVESPAPVHTFPWGRREKVLTRLNPRQLGDFIALGRLMISGRLALRRLVAETQAEVVLCMWAVPAGYWAYGSGRPYAVWTLGSDIWSIDKYPLGRAIVRRVIRQAGHVFGDGIQLANEVKQLAGRDCEFLPSCRSLPVANTPPAALPNDRLHFLFIGRWDRVKGIDLLLDAMDIVSTQMPEAHLHIFGGGPLDREIHRRTEQGRLRESVSVHGYADPAKAVAYLKTCHALVIASRIESIPVVYSDALQCGCPVIATDVGDLGRLIRQQETGLLCQPNNSTALAEAMCMMAAHTSAGLRARYATALSRAAQMFDPARSATRCVEVLQRLSLYSESTADQHEFGK